MIYRFVIMLKIRNFANNKTTLSDGRIHKRHRILPA